jgi:hypothetical protein
LPNGNKTGNKFHVVATVVCVTGDRKK